jgi:hypothetical protein
LPTHLHHKKIEKERKKKKKKKKILKAKIGIDQARPIIMFIKEKNSSIG